MPELRFWLLVLASLLTVASPAPAQETPDWLSRYHRAITSLSLPIERRYEQQIQTYGWQEAITAGEFVFRADGGWEANLTEGDHFYRLSSDGLVLVSEADRLGLYSEYSRRPARVAPHALIDLDADTTSYRVTAAETTSLGDNTVYHLHLAPTAGGPLRDLWLDPATALPRRATAHLAGVWGVADFTLDFQPVGTYWLPERSRTQIQMNFWVPVGFTRRTFAGSLDVGSLYREYRFGDSAPLPAVPAAQPQRALPAPASPDSSNSKILGNTLELSVSNQQARSPLAERIAQFNLNKPDLSDPLTRINIFMTLKMGSGQLLLYLFRFDSKQPLIPLEPATPQNDSIRLFGTNN